MNGLYKKDMYFPSILSIWGDGQPHGRSISGVFDMSIGTTHFVVCVLIAIEAYIMMIVRMMMIEAAFVMILLASILIVFGSICNTTICTLLAGKNVCLRRHNSFCLRSSIQNMKR